MHQNIYGGVFCQFCQPSGVHSAALKITADVNPVNSAVAPKWSSYDVINHRLEAVLLSLPPNVLPYIY